MNYLRIVPAAASQSIEILILKDNGQANTALLFNSSGLALKYRRGNGALTAIALVTLASATTAYSSGGFIHVGSGVYRLDLPNAALAAGSTTVTIVADEATDIRAMPVRIQLDDSISSRMATFTYTAPPAASTIADVVWSFSSVFADFATGQLLNMAYLNSAAVSDRLTVDRASYLDNLNVGGGLYGAAQGTQDAMDTLTAIGNVPALVWAALTSATTMLGSFGKLLKDQLNASVGSRATAGDVSPTINFTPTINGGFEAEDRQNLATLGTSYTAIATSLGELNTTTSQIGGNVAELMLMTTGEGITRAFRATALAAAPDEEAAAPIEITVTETEVRRG